MDAHAARVDAFERSPIRVMFDMAAEAERNGDDPVRLEVGEPDFNTPAHVTRAAFEAARDGATDYTESTGIEPLRTAIADRLATYGVDHSPEDVVVTTGGMEALHVTDLAIVDPGDEVVVPTPAWPNYEIHAALADGSVRSVPMPPPYDLDADRVIEAMGPKTAAVLLTSPSNPTGRVYDPEPVRAVVEAAADHDTYVIADEVYAGLTFDREPQGVAGMVDDARHVITVGSMSKTHAMTGWRLGWLAAVPSVVEATTAVREATTSCPAAPAQHAAVEALTNADEAERRMYESFRDRRDYVADRLAAIDGVSAPHPQGAFYAFVDIEGEDDGLAAAKRLLRDGNVALAPGTAFTDDPHGRVRLSFANSMDRLEEGLDRIEATV